MKRFRRATLLHIVEMSVIFSLKYGQLQYICTTNNYSQQIKLYHEQAQKGILFTEIYNLDVFWYEMSLSIIW